MVSFERTLATGVDAVPDCPDPESSTALAEEAGDAVAIHVPDGANIVNPLGNPEIIGLYPLEKAGP